MANYKMTTGDAANYQTEQHANMAASTRKDSSAYALSHHRQNFRSMNNSALKNESAKLFPQRGVRLQDSSDKTTSVFSGDFKSQIDR